MIDATGNPQTILLLGGTRRSACHLRAYLQNANARVILADLPAEPRREGGHRAAAGRRGQVGEFFGLRRRRHQEPPPLIESAWANGDVDVAIVAFGLLGDAEELWQRTRPRRSGRTGQLPRRPSRSACWSARRCGHRASGRSSRMSQWRANGWRGQLSCTAPTKAGLDGFSTSDSERRCARFGFTCWSSGPARCDHNPLSIGSTGAKEVPFTVNKEDVAALAVPRPPGQRIWSGRQAGALPDAVMRHIPRPIFRKLPI